MWSPVLSTGFEGSSNIGYGSLFGWIFPWRVKVRLSSRSVIIATRYNIQLIVRCSSWHIHWNQQTYEVMDWFTDRSAYFATNILHANTRFVILSFLKYVYSNTWTYSFSHSYVDVFTLNPLIVCPIWPHHFFFIVNSKSKHLTNNFVSFLHWKSSK